MKKNFQTVSDAAAFLADEPAVKKAVDRDIVRSSLVTALLNLRVHKGLSQKQIADAMHCDPSKISKLESGDDWSLKWIDVVGYLAAMNMNTSLVFEDESLPAAARIKQCVFRIHDLLESLTGLAKEVDGDTDITEKIHQFYGEVLFNFLSRFEDSYTKLNSALKVPEAETRALLQMKKPVVVKSKGKKPVSA